MDFQEVERLISAVCARKSISDPAMDDVKLALQELKESPIPSAGNRRCLQAKLVVCLASA